MKNEQRISKMKLARRILVAESRVLTPSSLLSMFLVFLSTFTPLAPIKNFSSAGISDTLVDSIEIANAQTDHKVAALQVPPLGDPGRPSMRARRSGIAVGPAACDKLELLSCSM